MWQAHRTIAMAVLGVACIVAFYAALSISNTSLEDLLAKFPALKASHIKDEASFDILNGMKSVSTCAYIAALLYGAAAVGIYIKRNCQTTILCVVAAISLIIVIIAFLQFPHVYPNLPVYHADRGYVSTPTLINPLYIWLCGIMATAGLVSAYIARLETRIRKNALLALDPAQQQLHAVEISKAKMANVVAIILTVLTVVAAISLCLMISTLSTFGS